MVQNNYSYNKRHTDRLAAPIKTSQLSATSPTKSIQAVVLIISKKRERKSFGLGDMPLRRACLVKARKRRRQLLRLR